jgi:hypothetical protein
VGNDALANVTTATGCVSSQASAPLSRSPDPAPFAQPPAGIEKVQKFTMKWTMMLAT